MSHLLWICAYGYDIVKSNAEDESSFSYREVRL